MSLPDIREAAEQISILNNPFQSDKLEGVMIHCSKNIFIKAWQYNGYVEFKHDDTKGRQDFRGTSLAEVLHKIEGFMKSLETIN